VLTLAGLRRRRAEILGVALKRRAHRPQLRVGSTQPATVIRHRLTGHAPQAPAPAGTQQTDSRRSRSG